MPVGWLTDTAALYGQVFRRSATLALRNWTVGLAVFAYAVVLYVATLLAAPFGLIGGFLLYLALVACASSGLSLVEHTIRIGRARLTDLPAGFGTYFGELLTVGFLLFLLQLVASLALEPFPLLRIVFRLAVLAFLNAVPELIYLDRQEPAELLAASYRFIGENWIEWFVFPPNVLLALVALLGVPLPPPLDLIGWMALGVLFPFLMVARGLLFLELASSGRRAREFRRRAAG